MLWTSRRLPYTFGKRVGQSPLALSASAHRSGTGNCGVPAIPGSALACRGYHLTRTPCPEYMPLSGGRAAQIRGCLFPPNALIQGGTGPRGGDSSRADLTIPPVLRVDRSASGFVSAELTGMRR